MMKIPHEEGKTGMSLKKYEAFVRTVELGSLTRAAEAMGSTQSRISHVLSTLEEEYGFVLLRRNRSGIRLTEAGAMVLPKMQEILQKDRELTELIGDIRSADAGTVRLGAFTSVAVHWLPGMIRTFQSAHPKAELKMFNGDYHDMEQWLREGEVDLGFVTLPAPEGMRTIPLTQDPLVAIMPKNHRLAQLEEIPIQELGEDPFISLLQSSAHDIHRALDNAGVRPNIKFTTKDDYAILAMVEQGLGMSVMNKLITEKRICDIAMLPVDPPASITLGIALHSRADLSPAVRRFLKYAVRMLTKQEKHK